MENISQIIDLSKLHEDDETLFEKARKGQPYIYFEKQIDRIQNATHKKLIMNYLFTRKDNWLDHVEKPTSSSGKYHPSYQNTRCGNGKHIKNVVNVIDVFKRAFPRSVDWDAVYAAAILHDLSKYNPDFTYTDSNHGDIEADKFKDVMHNMIGNLEHEGFFKNWIQKRKMKKWVKLVEHLIRWHDGRFNPKNAKEKDDIKNNVVDTFYKQGKYVEVFFIHLADMVSANKVLAETPFI